MNNKEISKKLRSFIGSNGMVCEIDGSIDYTRNYNILVGNIIDLIFDLQENKN